MCLLGEFVFEFMELYSFCLFISGELHEVVVNEMSSPPFSEVLNFKCLCFVASPIAFTSERTFTRGKKRMLDLIMVSRLVSSSSFLCTIDLPLLMQFHLCSPHKAGCVCPAAY